MKFGVLGICCRILIAYFIANHLNVNGLAYKLSVVRD